MGTQHGSDRYRLTGQLTWQWQRLAADLFVYYRPGYTNDRPGSCNNVVGRCLTSFQQLPEFDATSLTTVDLSASYWFDNGLRVRAGGRNLFERESPSPWAFCGILGYDPTRWDARAAPRTYIPADRAACGVRRQAHPGCRALVDC